MDLQQYTKDAIRTESRIDEVCVDPELLSAVLGISIATGNMLDQIKKKVFYDKDYDATKLKEGFISIAMEMDTLQKTIKDIELMEPKLTVRAEDQYAVDVNPRLFHSLVGAATEATELLEALVNIMQGKADPVNVLEEFGDIAWYQAIAFDELGGDWERTFHNNIEKLKARYPEKFTSEDTINRDLETEREILETNELEK